MQYFLSLIFHLHFFDYSSKFRVCLSCSTKLQRYSRIERNRIIIQETKDFYLLIQYLHIFEEHGYWLQRDSNPQPLSSKTSTQPFSQTVQIIELCCELWAVSCFYLYLPLTVCFYNISQAFRVNLNSVVASVTPCSGAISEI